MKPGRLITAALFLLLIASSGHAGWEADLADALEMEAGDEQDKLIASVVRAHPDVEEVTALIEGIPFPSSQIGKLILDSSICIDDVERPWVLYVPPAYEPEISSPLLVRLHGGVGRAEIIEDPVGLAEEDSWLPVAEKEGWLVLYPFGQIDATWWDEVGMANVTDLIRTVKRRYNIDDDRVWMAGFSDGASAGFTWAMVRPNDLAAVVALNGHIGVGSLDGELPLHAVNLANIPIYAVTTFEDELYPSAVMRPTLEMAIEAGADMLYRELEGTHDFDYADREIPRITDFLLRHPRDPFPAEITWEAGDRNYGACRWLKIEDVTLDEPAPWHRDHNAALVSERITIGFMSDDAFKGKGVGVGRVMDDSPAEEMGLEDGDIIIAGDRMSIEDMDDLLEFKSTLERGDQFQLTVRRGEGTAVLEGRIPEPENYYVFARKIPSGLVKARYLGNRIEIQSSRVGTLTILIHPDMINLEEALLVIWNGRTVLEDEVKPDVDYLIRNFIGNRDRSLLYVAEVSLEAPE